MFKTKTFHICAIADTISDSCLPVLSPLASNWEKWKRFCKKLILVTEVNPTTNQFYRKRTRIVDERKAQIDSGSWIIHPFSIFRLYYEMYMCLVFLVCLIYMPLYAAFHYSFGYKMLAVRNVLSGLCYVDVAISFICGRCISQEEIVMKPGKIAKAYIFGPYFICDVLSSLPPELLPDYLEKIEILIGYLSLLKLVRIVTFQQYMSRMFSYFEVGGFSLLIIRVTLFVLLICHYVACFLNFAIIVFRAVVESDETFEKLFAKPFEDSYLYFVYYGASLILGVEVLEHYDQVPTVYIVSILWFVIGKLIVAFLTVILMEVFKVSSFVEVKYQEVISQVNSYMSAHKYPASIQNKVRLFYYNKYHGRYLNENHVERFISDKLKKEVKYHECRKLIRSVAIFQNLPQEIIENILLYLKIDIFMAGDTIIKAGTIGECMYFMSSGTVAVVSPSGKEICHLEDGDFFGEICLLSSRAKRTATVIALESCELYRLDNKHFRKCFDLYPEVFKIIHNEGKRRWAHAKVIERESIKSCALEVLSTIS